MSEGLPLPHYCDEGEHGDYNCFSLRPATDGSPQTGDDGLLVHFVFIVAFLLLYAVLAEIYNVETLNVLNHGEKLY